MKYKNIVLGAALMACSFLSQATLIDFDSLAANDMVDDFYSAENVQFQAGDWLASSGFGETSAPNFATSLSGIGYVNILDGFTDEITFTYGAFVDSIVNIFDGADGTGNLLGSINLVANDITSFDFASLAFSGVGYSISIASQSGVFAWDDLAFSNIQAVPAPSILAIFSLGIFLTVRLTRKTTD
ncbi:hypothetical protein [Paraglaciecola sp.]|uniref:hypothetical protein n=1 Tax=Paraglaciecola sp. TaxID=1920173 RepID=UPI00273FAC17|nr:hypothetical protein [Paraglaciecola sp.]MDP5031707.1 hypothetical protein [Paraglaciecola sp.]